jgi:Leucine-rich repeat (LRR) protein
MESRKGKSIGTQHNLKSIPDKVFTFDELTRLFVNKNKIVHISPKNNILVNLTHLALDKNRIIKICNHRNHRNRHM